ncbi:MAG TPA: class I SAM-dependent methyltransferase [Gaiellaceae bacterium]
MFHARRLSFGDVADLYERARPSYPPEAARWMLGEAPLRVVDLGAGTGKFTRVVADLGHDVVAVEPDPGMRAALVAATPGVEVLDGSGEAIPLPSSSVDAVVAAQSFHWFDNDESKVEIARVLKPGGVLAPIWNVRDESVPWVAELSRAVLEGDPSAGDHAVEVDFGPLFRPAARREFRHADQITAATLLDLVHSRSKYLIADAEERARLDGALGAITSALPEVFEFPYVTVAFRAERL